MENINEIEIDQLEYSDYDNLEKCNSDDCFIINNDKNNDLELHNIVIDYD